MTAIEERIDRVNQQLTGGVTPAMATPLDPQSKRVRLDVVPVLMDFLIERGVRGFFVGGTTGEGVLLDSDQRRALHEAAVAAAAGRVPVLAHAGALQSAEAVMLARHAAECGADAIVAVTPIFYGLHEDALFAYYKDISDAAPQTPLFAYDIPQMAVNGISPRLAARMFAELPTLAGLKSSQQDAQMIRRLLDVVPEGRVLLAGNESIALGTLALGADGMISGLATAVPEPFVAMIDALTRVDLAEARRQQRLINRLLALLPAGARIGAIKAILEARGVPVGPPMPPMPSVEDGRWAEMVEILGS